MPRVAQRMEKLLRDAPPDNLEAAVRSAQGLSHAVRSRTTINPRSCSTSVNADWQSNAGASMSKEQRQDLEGHFRRLLEGRVRQSPLARDDALIAQARSQLGRYTPAKRIYGQLKGLAVRQAGTQPRLHAGERRGSGRQARVRPHVAQAAGSGHPGPLHAQWLSRVAGATEQSQEAGRARRDMGGRTARSLGCRRGRRPHRRSHDHGNSGGVPDRIPDRLGRVPRRPAAAAEHQHDRLDPDAARSCRSRIRR